MVTREPEYACSATGALYSRMASAALRAIVDGGAEPGGGPVGPASSGPGWRWGGAWFCPADARPMSESDGVIGCRACGRSLPGPLVHQLIELNPHVGPPV
jgi:hypothetical protein